MQIWQHHFERRLPILDVPVSVVKVINDADVILTEFTQSLANRDQVFGFAAPSAVIVKTKLTTHRLGALSESEHLLRGGFYLGRLIVAAGVRERPPDLRMQIVF